jgi:hypothetical protein
VFRCKRSEPVLAGVVKFTERVLPIFRREEERCLRERTTAVGLWEFSKHFRLFDQYPRPLDSRFALWRSIAFHVEERGYERGLELDLILPKGRSAGQGRNQVEAMRQLLYSFDQGRALQRPQSGSAPKTRSPLDQASFSAVTREQFRLALPRRSPAVTSTSPEDRAERRARSTVMFSDLVVLSEMRRRDSAARRRVCGEVHGRWRACVFRLEGSAAFRTATIRGISTREGATRADG